MEVTSPESKMFEILDHFNLEESQIGRVAYRKLLNQFRIGGDNLNAGKVKLDLFEGASKMEVAFKYRITIDAVTDIIFDRSENGLYPNAFYSEAAVSSITGHSSTLILQRFAKYKKHMREKISRFKSGEDYISALKYSNSSKNNAPDRFMSFTRMKEILGESASSALSCTGMYLGMNVSSKKQNNTNYYSIIGVKRVKEVMVKSFYLSSVEGWLELDSRVRLRFCNEFDLVKYGKLRIDNKHKSLMELFIKEMTGVSKGSRIAVLEFKALHLV